jgi:cytochrome b6-f complex iron-sulfur subunit
VGDRTGPPAGATRRRALLGGLAAICLSPLLLAWLRLGAARQDLHGPKRILLPRPNRDGVVFHDTIILVRTGEELHALSAKCPHLGCRIPMVVGNELVCPCHGSTFDLGGQRLSGPASANLEKLALEPDAHTETISVALPD